VWYVYIGVEFRERSRASVGILEKTPELYAPLGGTGLAAMRLISKLGKFLYCESCRGCWLWEE